MLVNYWYSAVYEIYQQTGLIFLKIKDNLR